MWLHDAVVLLWVARHPVTEWIQDSYDAVERVDGAYQMLSEALRSFGEDPKPARTLIIDLLEACRDLSQAVSKFPISSELFDAQREPLKGPHY